jgi:citrate synthase
LIATVNIGDTINIRQNLRQIWSTTMKTNDLWITRQAATEALGVRQQTLYAYVSRGLIRTRPDTNDPRRSSYSKYDIQALVERKRGSRRRTDIATGAIAWGEPVLESAISTVRDGQLIFRGREAAELANRATLEEAAGLLWQCDVPDAATLSREGFSRGAPAKTASAKARAFDYLAAMANTQPPSYGRSETLQQNDAWALLYGFADTLAGEATSGLIHQRLASAWGLDSRGAEIVRRALVLIADHELNASTFAVRVAASTGASLAASALAGFCALSGPLHGQASARALVLLDRIVGAEDAKSYIRALVERGEPFLGFNHQLYPLGDIRAISLLRALKASPRWMRALRLAEKETGLLANVDMALAVMTRELNLIDEAPFVLFAVGRMTGWLAHAMEQRQTGRLIRPRARYVGL